MSESAISNPEKSSARRILFVDDDPQFLQMIERVMLLWSKSNLEILSAESVSAALKILQDQPLDLVVLDVCMPVVDGLQFLSMLNRRYPGLQKVVLTGYATEAYRTACLSNGAELFLEKPRTSDGMESIFATLDELARWKPEPGFRGVLRRVGLIDVIQMECLARSSSLLAVTGPNASGSIYIKEGAIIHAECGPLKGEEAFKKLLTLASGDFRLNPFAEPPEQTIASSWESLLMDAAQSRDEALGSLEAGAAAGLPALEIKPLEPPPETRELRPSLPIEVDELMICSEAGDVYHAWQCANTDLRINFLEFLSQKARLLHNVLPLGVFDRAEFHGVAGRLVGQIGSGRGVILRTSPAGTATAKNDAQKPRNLSVAPTPERKEKARLWFQEHVEVAGLLAATLQFSDRSGSVHSVSGKFQEDALETMRRAMSDAFQVLGLQRFRATRARWIYDQTAIESAQWSDGTTIAFVFSRQNLELNAALVERRICEFMAEDRASSYDA